MCLKPPFRALDMQGLYRKVIRGEYERVPNRYTSDLAALISICLKQNPKLRPSSSDLLKNTVFIKNIKRFLGNDHVEKKNEKQ